MKGSNFCKFLRARQEIFKIFFSKKFSLFLIFVLGVILIGMGKSFVEDYYSHLKNESTVRMFAVGDIMLSQTRFDGVNPTIQTLGEGDYRYPFLNIVEDFKEADILFGNLEFVITDKGERIVKPDRGGGYFFRVKPKAIEGLKFAGFDILSVANNHTFDYGREGMEDSLRRLKEAEIEYVGAGFNDKETWSLKIIENKKNKIGFLAYTYKTSTGPQDWQSKGSLSGIAWINRDNIERIKKDIIDARKKVDVLIISVHWGVQYSTEPTSEQVFLGRAMIDAGADLILGHHPHVIQPIEKYKEGWIVYSLGNFVFDSKTRPETMAGLLLETHIRKGVIKKIIPKIIKIPHDTFQPYILLDYSSKVFY